MRNSKYTKEFRDSSVQLAMNGEHSTLKIAGDLDINPKTLYNWIREYKKAHNIKIDERRKEQRGISKEGYPKRLSRMRIGA